MASRRQYAPRLSPEDRRTQILDAALSVIVRDGYEKISIDAIAREAAITRPVVYSSYDGLAPLLIALLDRQQERAVAQLIRVMPSLKRFDLAHFADSIEAWLRLVSEDPVTWRPILASQHATPALVRERIESTKTAIRQQLAALVQIGYPQLDAEITAHMLLAIFEHFGSLLLEGHYTPERLASAIQAVFPPPKL